MHACNIAISQRRQQGGTTSLPAEVHISPDSKHRLQHAHKTQSRMAHNDHMVPWCNLLDACMMMTSPCVHPKKPPITNRRIHTKPCWVQHVALVPLVDRGRPLGHKLGRVRGPWKRGKMVAPMVSNHQLLVGRDDTFHSSPWLSQNHSHRHKNSQHDLGPLILQRASSYTCSAPITPP